MISIDSHVHIYSKAEVDNFLETVTKNIDHSARGSRVLFLTESQGLNFFKEFTSNVYNWNFKSNKDKISLTAISPAQEKIVILNGKQLTTKENLEVLSVGCSEAANYLSLQDTVNEILNKGGIPIIPWGFGKWWGTRGKILNDFLLNTDLTCFFLGDNSGRPNFLPYPVQFKIAAEKGIKILPGSDPLPIPGDYKRAGSYGFILDEELNEEKPAEHIKQLLFSLKNNPEYFGKRNSSFSFFKRQALLRFHKIRVK